MSEMSVKRNRRDALASRPNLTKAEIQELQELDADLLNHDLDYVEQLKCDPVESPSHYTRGGIEAIDYMQAKLTPIEFKGYLKGSCLKYLSRAGYKADELEDLKKARWYVEKLIEVMEEK